jgi:hypothetical protein
MRIPKELAKAGALGAAFGLALVLAALLAMGAFLGYLALWD